MNQKSPPSASKATSPPRVAIICADWHAELVNVARDSLQDRLVHEGVPIDAIEHHRVPGSFEIPLRAQLLAKSGRVDAIVACALVIDGGIYRHEFVSAAVIDGLMRVMLDTGVPVPAVVLTPHQYHEHEPHRRFFGVHLVVKGREAAHAVLNTLKGMAPLRAAA
jgi:6,7-dimethyl-8-ribityllumazine synthase